MAAGLGAARPEGERVEAMPSPAHSVRAVHRALAKNAQGAVEVVSLDTTISVVLQGSTPHRLLVASRYALPHTGSEPSTFCVYPAHMPLGLPIRDSQPPKTNTG